MPQSFKIFAPCEDFLFVIRTACSAAERYPRQAGGKVSDEELAAVNIVPCDFHGEWNYTIRPSRKTR